MQDEMAKVCMDYAKGNVDAVYIYCYAGPDARHIDCAFLQKGHFRRKHELNKGRIFGRTDTSIQTQGALCDSLNHAIDKASMLMQPFPVQFKLIYDNKKNCYFADYEFETQDANRQESIQNTRPFENAVMPEGAVEWFREKVVFFNNEENNL